MDRFALANRNDPNNPVRHHFLGCSIRNFDLNMGWSNESSTLTVGLVEDDLIFERFNGNVGELVRFQYDQFFFDGILTEITESKSESGNRLWDVTISDPRELLDGVILILDQYSGFTYGISNLYNIFGYLESTGFGNAGVNSSGMLLSKIRSAFTTLNLQFPVYLGGTPIIVDISSLPGIDPNFRISDTNVSLLRLITDVCEIANCDFTFVMIGNYFKLRVISRNIPQLNGSIYRFIQRLQQVTSSQAGFKLQYNPCSKFIVGGPVEQIYYQVFNTLDEESLEDDTISRYFGLNYFGNINTVYKNEQEKDNHLITIPSRQIGYDYYPSDMEELRAAAKGIEAWEAYLNLNKNKPQHADKLPKLSFGELKDDLKKRFDDMVKANDKDISFSSIELVKHKEFELDQQKVFYTERVHQFLSTFANYFLDTHFMVRLPYVRAKYDNELKKVITSVQPTEYGYIDEKLHPQMIMNGLLPEYSNLVLDENNKIQAFARFGPFTQRDQNGFFSIASLDITGLNEGDYYIQDVPHQQYGFVSFVFVKCELEPDLVFISKQNAYSPRAVIKLAGPVYYTPDFVTTNIFEKYFIQESLIKKYGEEHAYNILDILATLKNGFLLDSAKEIVQEFKEQFKAIKSKIGFDFINHEFKKIGLIPELVAIPLKSNVETYGPWYFKRNNGKTIYENNSDMVPWNYGGFDNLNKVAMSLVNEVSFDTMIEEDGSIETPGTPIFQLVDEIVPTGPVITGISTSIGDGGVRTTYRMEKWKANYGKLNQIRIEHQKKLLQEQRDNNRRFRELFRKPEPINKANALFRISPQRQVKRKNRNTSSHLAIFSEIIKTNDSGYKINTGVSPSYYMENLLNRNGLSGIHGLDSIASIGLDSLFMPYDIKENKYMPYTRSGVSESDGVIDFHSLNPLKSGHIINTFEKGVALRGPVMIAGWGYDISGNPVPSDGSDFPEDYLKDPSKWKVGPLDARWDEERGVWAAGGGGTAFFRLAEDMIGTEAYARECNHDGSGVNNDKPPIKVINWQGIINGAKAGYIAKYELHKGKWKFGQGLCPDNRCVPSSGYLSVPTFPDGVISGFYEAEINYNNIIGNVNNTILPPGLIRNGKTISGYPVESGDFYITFTGAAETLIDNKPATCLITRMGKITIKASGVS